MHELSIVMGIIELAEKEAEKAGVQAFTAIDIEIGTLSGVVTEALDFAWQSAVKGTVLEHAQKNIISIPALAECLDCGKTFPGTTLYELCPECGSYYTRLLKGKELRVKSLIYES